MTFGCTTATCYFNLVRQSLFQENVVALIASSDVHVIAVSAFQIYKQEKLVVPKFTVKFHSCMTVLNF